MKIDSTTIRQLSRWMHEAGIDELDLSTPGSSLSLRRQRDASAVQTAIAPSYTLTAPRAGIYHDRHPMTDAALLAPGDRVVAGQLVGLLQIGMLLLPLRAARAGRVLALPRAGGRRVGDGEPLLQLHADAEETA